MSSLLLAACCLALFTTPAVNAASLITPGHLLLLSAPVGQYLSRPRSLVRRSLMMDIFYNPQPFNRKPGYDFPATYLTPGPTLSKLVGFRPFGVIIGPGLKFLDPRSQGVVQLITSVPTCDQGSRPEQLLSRLILRSRDLTYLRPIPLGFILRARSNLIYTLDNRLSIG